ncbi:uncharacterized protein LOC100678036 isoform X2 [Nasonia vitripennis]|uniref:Uncharacterized protein n=1 Tax=Nasonia vitripennis TaxID=7425 RepID=A0A7M7GFE3_NASVI|nr:uncharacterized protein LOC100678036 isoform X2 [Nasonia vitripennis]
MNVWIFLIVALHSISGLKLISEAASIANYGKGKYPPLCPFKLCILPSKVNFDVIIGGIADSDHYNVFARPTRNFVINIIYFVMNRNKVTSDDKVVKSDDEVAESAPVTEAIEAIEAIEAEKDNERKQNEGSSRPKRDICYFKICSMNPPSGSSTTPKPN